MYTSNRQKVNVIKAYLEGSMKAAGESKTDDPYMLGYIQAVKNMDRLVKALEAGTYPDYEETK